MFTEIRVIRVKTSPTKISFGDSIRIFLQGNVEQYPGKSDFVVRFPKRFLRENFNSDFSNYKNILKKNIFNLKYNDSLIRDKIIVDEEDHRKTVVFYIKPKERGKNTIRGLFDEVMSLTPRLPNLYSDIYSREEIKALPTSSDTSTIETNTIYFDIPIEVTE